MLKNTIFNSTKKNEIFRYKYTRYIQKNIYMEKDEILIKNLKLSK